MKVIQKSIADKQPAYPIERLAPLDQILFLDIETTGLTAKSSNLYLIGCVYYRNDEWNTIQWLAENYDDELEVLKGFLEFCLDFGFFIHFNGNNFDIPYLQQKCNMYDIPFVFDVYNGVDLYRRIKPYKTFLKLPDCKQKTLEAMLGISRLDTFSGGELIEYYHDYVCTHDEVLLNTILLHNSEDIINMLDLVSILSISDLFNQPLRVMKVQANYYKDHEGQKKQELILNLRFISPLPLPLTFAAGGCYFTGNQIDGILKVPLYEEELKYFYSNYHDYYYLPSEDISIHKSVSSFVDKEHRVQASAANCYTRKLSTYLPQWELLFTPFFKRDYKSRDLFFELTDEFKTSRASFNQYASHVLQMMLTFDV